ncbi:hypothetical protein [Modestobacter lapidis]|nr:hypothetical protein [Modestobacter lapidis]
MTEIAAPPAFPFIEVTIDRSGIASTAQRAPGVIAIVGESPDDAAGGTQGVNDPALVLTSSAAEKLFAETAADGRLVADTALSRALKLALQQDPRPSTVYGVRAQGGQVAAALAALEQFGDVTLVCLAGTTHVGDEGPPATGLRALVAHVEKASGDGSRRLGVAMIDPAIERSPDYVRDVGAAYEPLRSPRLVLVAARGADGDAAAAVTATIAGHQPHISLVLKTVAGLSIPKAQQYTPEEIVGLSNLNIDPVIDPVLIPGRSLHLAEGRLFADDDPIFIDILRTIDDVEFRLKAGLMRSVGDARITRSGLSLLKTRIEGILGPLVRRGVLDGASVAIPVLDALSVPEAARTSSDDTDIRTARQTRSVQATVTIVYGPAVHHLLLNLRPTF